MARTVGPLMSFDASGKLANTVVFSKWKGRPYVRQLVTPSNPKTPLQVSTRAMMKFLAQAWTPDLSDSEKASYAAGAHADSVSEFNHFTRQNMKLWTQFAAPSHLQPPGSSNTLPTYTTPLAGTPGVGQATLTATFALNLNGWGIAIFRSLTTGFTPGRDNLVAVVDITGASTLTYVDTPLQPATYYYRGAAFTDDGNFDTPATQFSVVVS